MTTKKTAVAVRVPTADEMQQAADEFEASLAIPEVPIITSPALYEDAAYALKAVKAEQKRHEAALAAITNPIKESMAAAKALFAPALTRLANRELAIKNAILEWNREVERRQRAAQALLDEQRRKDEARAEARAAKLEAKGKVEQAEAVRDSVPPPVLAVADTVKVAGITNRTYWSAEVVHLALLVEYAAQMSEPDWLQANMPALNAYARSMRGSAKLPGVRFVETKGIGAG